MKLSQSNESVTNECVTNESENITDTEISSLYEDTVVNIESSVNVWEIQLEESDNEEGDNDDMVESEYSLDEIGANFSLELTQWAIKYQPSQAQLKGLLSVCNKTLPFQMPMDPRTLLHTPIDVKIDSIGVNEFYWHYGLKFALNSCFRILPDDLIPTDISLNINVDGVKIFKSSNEEFWPILFNIHELRNIEPKVIGIYCGKGVVI